MRRNSCHLNSPADKLVKDIHRVARKQYLAEEKTRIMLEELRRERQLWRGFALSPISVVGQQRNSASTLVMSALPLRADIIWRVEHVWKVLGTEVSLRQVGAMLEPTRSRLGTIVECIGDDMESGGTGPERTV